MPKRKSPSENTIDRISNVPESVLHHILSLLSTKKAAATSALSKQWRHLWTWAPNIDLSVLEIDAKGMTFEQLTLKILLLRPVWSIRKFTLLCDLDCGCDFVNLGLILCAAVARNIEELDFCMTGWLGDELINQYELPHYIYSSKTLVVLKLEGQVAINLGPISVQFPSLKVLHLINVKYKDEDSVRNLFSRCPVLDELYIQRCCWDNAHRYEVRSLTLRKLVLLCVDDRVGPSSKITVNAPALKDLTVDYEGVPGVLVLQNMDNLLKAKVNVHHLQEWAYQVDWGEIIGIFQSLCRVQFLELTFCMVETPDHCITALDNLTKFHNLVELKLVRFCCFWPLLLGLLHNCPQLKHLTLSKYMHSEHRHWEHSVYSCDETQQWMTPQHVPNCLSSHLTTLKFYWFQGLEVEMEFIRYVLEKSKVLTEVTICPCITDLRKRLTVVQRLCMFKRRSRRCRLNVQC